MKKLLAAGADANTRDNSGRTPLHAAVAGDAVSVVKVQNNNGIVFIYVCICLYKLFIYLLHFCLIIVELGVTMPSFKYLLAIGLHVSCPT